MTDFAIAVTLILAVFFSGALRAFVDKQIGIFLVSTGVSIVLSAAVIFDHYDAFTPLEEYLLVVLLMLLGAALSAFCKLSERFIIRD